MNALQDLIDAGGQLGRYFTPAQVADAKAYVGPLIVRAWVDLAILVGEFALLFALGLNARLRDLCARLASRLRARLKPDGLGARLARVMDQVWKGPGWGTAALFVILFKLAFVLLELPEHVYFDFLREKRMGLSAYTPGGWALDELKNLAVGMLGFLAAVVPLYALMRRFPRRWWLLLGVPVAVAMLASGLADPYRAKLLFDYTPLAAGPTRSAIEAVLARGHVPYQNVVVINAGRATTRADAYFAGEGPTRLIVLYDTLVSRYTPKEIAVVVAHEMGHLEESLLGHKIFTALVMVPLLFLFHLLLVAGARSRKLGFDSPTDIAGFPLLLLFFLLLTLVAGPFSNHFSRARESAADAFALRLTGDPQDFISLFAKLGVQNKADPVPAALTELWMYGHPPTARRIAMGLRYQQAHPTRSAP